MKNKVSKKQVRPESDELLSPPEHSPQRIKEVMEELRTVVPEKVDNGSGGVVRPYAAVTQLDSANTADAAHNLSSPEAMHLLSLLLRHVEKEDWVSVITSLPTKKLSFLSEAMMRESAYVRWEKMLKEIALRGLGRAAAIKKINHWIAEKSMSSAFNEATNNRRETIVRCLREIRDTLECSITYPDGKKNTKVTIRTAEVSDGTNRRRFIVQRSGDNQDTMVTGYNIPKVVLE